VDLSLDSNGKGWDQFETNERLYGVKTNYDESFYTTTIDKSHPDYKKRVAEADRIAREIEGTTAMNAHVAEERGGKAADDNSLDEESK
jgi:PAB1-binding protein PBP1